METNPSKYNKQPSEARKSHTPKEQSSKSNVNRRTFLKFSAYGGAAATAAHYSFGLWKTLFVDSEREQRLETEKGYHTERLKDEKQYYEDLVTGNLEGNERYQDILTILDSTKADRETLIVQMTPTDNRSIEDLATHFNGQASERQQQILQLYDTVSGQELTEATRLQLLTGYLDEFFTQYEAYAHNKDIAQHNVSTRKRELRRIKGELLEANIEDSVLGQMTTWDDYVFDFVLKARQEREIKTHEQREIARNLWDAAFGSDDEAEPEPEYDKVFATREFSRAEYNQVLQQLGSKTIEEGLNTYFVTLQDSIARAEDMNAQVARVATQCQQDGKRYSTQNKRKLEEYNNILERYDLSNDTAERKILYMGLQLSKEKIESTNMLIEQVNQNYREAARLNLLGTFILETLVTKHENEYQLNALQIVECGPNGWQLTPDFQTEVQQGKNL